MFSKGMLVSPNQKREKLKEQEISSSPATTAEKSQMNGPESVVKHQTEVEGPDSAGNNHTSTVESVVDEVLSSAPSSSQFGLEDTISQPTEDLSNSFSVANQDHNEDDSDDDFLPPDQDHNFVREQEKSVVNDSVVNAQFVSLQTEVNSLRLAFNATTNS